MDDARRPGDGAASGCAAALLAAAPAGVYTRIVTGTPPTTSHPWQPMYLKRTTLPNGQVSWEMYQ